MRNREMAKAQLGVGKMRVSSHNPVGVEHQSFMMLRTYGAPNYAGTIFTPRCAAFGGLARGYSGFTPTAFCCFVSSF